MHRRPLALCKQLQIFNGIFLREDIKWFTLIDNDFNLPNGSNGTFIFHVELFNTNPLSLRNWKAGFRIEWPESEKEHVPNRWIPGAEVRLFGQKFRVNLTQVYGDWDGTFETSAVDQHPASVLRKKSGMLRGSQRREIENEDAIDTMRK